MSVQRKAETRNGDMLLKTLFEPLGPIVANPGSYQFHMSINSLQGQILSPVILTDTATEPVEPDRGLQILQGDELLLRGS